MENSTLCHLKPIFHFLQTVPTPKLFPQALRNSAILECRAETKRRAHSLPGGPGRQKQSILPAAITGVCFLWFQRHCTFQTLSLLPNEESGSCSIETSATVHSDCVSLEIKWPAPLNLPALATRKETATKAFWEVGNETSCNYNRK